MVNPYLIAALQDAAESPFSLKDGAYLRERIHAILCEYIRAGWREDVVQVLRGWINGRSVPYTMIAVRIVGSERIQELKSDLWALRVDVSEGRVFRPYFLEDVDRALAELQQS